MQKQVSKLSSPAQLCLIPLLCSVWEVSKYEVISGRDTIKNRPEITPYFGHFSHSVG